MSLMCPPLQPVLFRALGLQFLLPRLWRKDDEPAKIAFAKGRRLALLRGSIHILPVGAAIALILLNCKGLYVGNSAEWISILQFVTKAFEMLMQASLAVVLLTYGRHECALSGGMPLGALFAGLHTLQLSHLWSLEFLGSLSATCLRGRRKYFFATFVPAVVILAAAVGPSGAIALIPRQIEYRWGSSRMNFYNITAAYLYPNILSADGVDPSCANATSVPYGAQSCPHSDWLSIPNLSSGQVQLTGVHAIRELSICEYSNVCIDTLATTQVAAVAEEFALATVSWAMYEMYGGGFASNAAPTRYRSHAQILHTAVAQQPFVTTNCVMNNLTEGGVDAELPIFFLKTQSWQDVGGWVQNAWSCDNKTQSYCTEYTYGTAAHPRLSESSVNRASVRSFAESHPSGGIMWVDLGGDLQQNTSIGAIVVQPSFNNSIPVDEGNILSTTSMQYAAACRISASYMDAVLNTTNDIVTLTGFVVQSSTFNGTRNDTHSWPQTPVQITKTWAELLTAPIVDQGWDNRIPIPFISQNTTVGAAIVNSFLVQGEIGGQHWGETPLGSEQASSMIDGVDSNGFDLQMSEEYDRWLNYEIMLSAMVASGMARNGNPELQPTDTYASVQFPGPNPCEIWGTACPLYSVASFGISELTQAQIDSPTNFRMIMHTTVSGLGYDLENVPIKLALAVLSLYIILAMSHFTYVVWTGVSSPSWDMVAEVTMLAWKSERSESLKHTSAGVQTMHVFQQPVSVKATGSDGLALVLERDGHPVERYGRVEKDHAY